MWVFHLCIFKCCLSTFTFDLHSQEVTNYTVVLHHSCMQIFVCLGLPIQLTLRSNLTATIKSGCNFNAGNSSHNTEPRVLPYKPAAIVHVPSNDVGLTTQKLRFPIPCIKPHLIAPKNCRPSRPVRSCPAVKSEKDAQKLQYFL